ncbi:acyl-CoA thioesterase [bacterium SCSIO 12696]|nr:acyl-CoA thioesterase [bacterium SCSIO 12696]
MQNHKLVLPEHLNHYGFLFGGYMLMWVDEIAYIAARLDLPEANMVTIGMESIEFHHSVKKGTILRFEADQKRLGNTSVQYQVNVYQGLEDGGEPVFSTAVTFVCVDQDGNKKPLPSRS